MRVHKANQIKMSFGKHIDSMLHHDKRQFRDNACRALRMSHDDSEIGATCTTSDTCSIANNSTTLSSSSLIEDIDENDSQRSKCIVEYVNDVMQDLLHKEKLQHSQLRPMSEEHNHCRSAILLWMHAVRERYALLLDTVVLAIAIMDRYFSAKIAETEAPNVVPQLELIHAGAALLLAAALEESFAPDAKDIVAAFTAPRFRKSVAYQQHPMVFQRASMYTEQSLCAATTAMAHTLQFDLWTATFLHFLRRYSRASQHSTGEHEFAKRFCLAALHHYEQAVLQFKPSQLAAAAVYHTRINHPHRFPKPWSKTLTHFSGYEREHVTMIYEKTSQVASINT